MKQHGLSKTPEYIAWRDMRARCLNKNNPKYKNWGARGIKICSQWRDDPVRFIKDMGHKPSSSFCLDRIDNDGDYTPDNCRWVDGATSRRNKRITQAIIDAAKRNARSLNKLNNYTGKPCMAYGRRFPSARSAALALGFNSSTITRWIASNKEKHKDFYYI